MEVPVLLGEDGLCWDDFVVVIAAAGELYLEEGF
jgi:hypothetical protein